jgi:hypothetical protein
MTGLEAKPGSVTRAGVVFQHGQIVILDTVAG